MAQQNTIPVNTCDIDRLAESLSNYGAASTIAKLSRLVSDYFALISDIQNGYGNTSRNSDEDARKVLQELREATDLTPIRVGEITNLVCVISEIISAAESINEYYA